MKTKPLTPAAKKLPISVKQDPPKESPPPQEQTQNCPNGICIGGNNSGNPTVINTKLSLPRVYWEPNTVDVNRKQNDHPITYVKVWTDGLFESPAFAVLCDRACKGYDFAVSGYNQNCKGNVTGEDKIAAFVLLAPNPFPSGIKANVGVVSADDTEVKVLGVRTLRFTDPSKSGCQEP